jgi:hypothetical protein
VNRPRSTPSRLGLLFSVSALLASIFILIGAAQLPRPRISSVSDWSHHHLIYSQPSSWVSAWYAQQEPRYWQQKIRRGEMNERRAAQEIGEARESRRWERSIDDGPGADWARDPFRFRGPTPPGWGIHPREATFQRDWGTSLGAGGSTGVPVSGTTWFPVYPAKFSFDTTATPDCTNDYVVYPTNLAGVKNGQASIIAYNKLYSGTPAATAFCGTATPAVYWSYNTNFNAAGGATTGTIATSPIISADGTKVAFIENNGGAGAVLHLLKWNAGDGGAINTAINPTTTTSWTSCPATGACMISITFANTAVDLGSSPFYDYRRDALYVGDDANGLHKFANVFGLFSATPSEVTTSGWPFKVDTTVTAALTSPVLDGTSGNIFVADANGTLTYIRETFSTAGTCGSGTLPCIGSTTVAALQAHSIIDSPIVDSSTQKVFVFYGNYDGTNTAVVQSDTTLSARVAANTGSKLIQRHMHAGAFDNTYLSGTGNTGRLYLCGSSATNLPTLQRIGFNNTATTFANKTGTMNTTVDATPVLQVASTAVDCSPLTEFFNTNAAAASQDQVFFGVASSGAGAACTTTRCVMSVNITNIPTTLTINNSIAEITGPSGIIVDNAASTTPVTGFPQASSLYFSNQGNSTAAVPCGATSGVGCAVKVTQSGLN